MIVSYLFASVGFVCAVALSFAALTSVWLRWLERKDNLAEQAALERLSKQPAAVEPPPWDSAEYENLLDEYAGPGFADDTDEVFVAEPADDPDALRWRARPVAPWEAAHALDEARDRAERPFD